MASDERATKARNRLAASQREATSLAGDPGGGWMLSACVECGGLPGGRLSQTYFVTRQANQAGRSRTRQYHRNQLQQRR